MLTPFDDYLIHQTPDTVDHVASSDRNFYDRYYFSCHDLKGETFLVVAMGAYPNLGVIDAFATCVQRNKRQFVVRASRELRGDRSRTSIGPIGVEVPSRFWAATAPRQQMNSGWMIASCSSRYSRQLAASWGNGARFPGGRHLIVLRI